MYNSYVSYSDFRTIFSDYTILKLMIPIIGIQYLLQVVVHIHLPHNSKTRKNVACGMPHFF
jgi:hypothetical protein